MLGFALRREAKTLLRGLVGFHLWHSFFLGIRPKMRIQYRIFGFLDPQGLLNLPESKNRAQVKVLKGAVGQGT